MIAPTEAPERPTFVPVGDNAARAFGMDARSRATALAAKAGMNNGASAPPGAAVVLGSLDYAWDPAWAKMIARKPGSILVKDGRAVLAHVPPGMDPEPIATAMRDHAPVADSHGLDVIDADKAELSNPELRKRERPFVLPLVAGQEDIVERAAYDASYKGVTDALTLYLWRKPAFYLTRWAARPG